MTLNIDRPLYLTLLASLRTLQIMRQEQGEGANESLNYGGCFSNFEFLRDERGKRRVTSGLRVVF